MSDLIEYTSPIPDGWEIMNFNETYTSVTLNKIKIKQKDYLTKGNYPVVDQGQELIGGYFDNIQYVIKEEPPFLVFGDHTKVKKFINFKFVAGADGVKVLKPNKHINPKLLFFFLHCFKIPDRGYARHFQFLNNAEFPLPPLAEQQRILAKIEELFSELDKGIETLKTAQQQLKVYRQAVLKYAFEGKLTNPDLKERELPAGWEIKKISDIAKINPTLPNKEVIDRNLIVQFLPMKLVEEIVNKIHLTETRKFVDVLKGSYTPFINNDIIFAKVTPCMENGKIAIVNNLINGIGFGSSEFHVLRCNEKMLNRYLHRFIVQDKFRNEAQKAMTGAVGLRRVPKQFIENYLIPVPNTLEEQSKIIQEIESRLSVCDKIEESIEQGLQQAAVLRQSILKKAFEGKLVLQDLNDEPASVLLERIKEERAIIQPVQKTKTKNVK